MHYNTDLLSLHCGPSKNQVSYYHQSLHSQGFIPQFVKLILLHDIQVYCSCAICTKCWCNNQLLMYHMVKFCVLYYLGC